MKNTFPGLSLIKAGFITGLIFFGFTSCEYENAEINSGSVPVSYSGDIALIISRSCAVTDCHVVLSSIGNFNEYSELKSRIENGKFKTMVFEMKLMPPAGYPSLTESEIIKLKKWLEEGATMN